MPSADANSMSIRGPTRKTLRTSSEMPIVTAIAGNSQTSEMFQRRASTMVGCGRSPAPSGAGRGGSGAAAPGAAGGCAGSGGSSGMGIVPDQLGIEGIGGEHRQDDDGGE